MNNINYIGAIVKIIEIPKITILNDDFDLLEFRVQIPQSRHERIVNLVCLGNAYSFEESIFETLIIGDYIAIEGYTSTVGLEFFSPPIEILLLKVYPLILD